MSDLDFLDDQTPTVSEPEPITLAQRIVEATAARDAAKGVFEAATKYLNDLIREATVPEVEVPLHVRNAEARRIDADLAQDHRAALAKLEAMGIDAARIIREGARPRQRKPVPPLFKP